MVDAAGKSIRRLSGAQAPATAGLHRMAWDLRAEGGGGVRGPQVLPGTYTVRLVADGVAAEQKVEVRLDPEIKTSAADLKAQWEAVTKVAGMIREVDEMTQEAHRHAGSAEWEAFLAGMVRPRTGAGSDGAPRLAEQLPALFNLMDGPNDAPTAAMMHLLGELEADYAKATAAFQALKH